MEKLDVRITGVGTKEEVINSLESLIADLKTAKVEHQVTSGVPYEKKDKILTSEIR